MSDKYEDYKSLLIAVERGIVGREEYITAVNCMGLSAGEIVDFQTAWIDEIKELRAGLKFADDV